jgi:SAM-dependent methyltransferase
VDRNAQWWRDEAPRLGHVILDKTLAGSADWDRLLASGREDLGHAIARSGMRVGKDLRCLDLGCGVGRLTSALADHFGKVVGLDIAPAFIEEARRHNTAANVRFVVGDGTTLAAAGDGRFDTVFCYEVFHHVPLGVLASYAREAHARLSPGGQFVFECNVMPHTWRSRLAARLRQSLHLVGVRRWRGWPTDPEFARVAHSVPDITGAIVAAGLRVHRVNTENPAQGWFVAEKPG